ncbi:MAG: hypothetical protein HYU39_04645 [Thaumarchaeota archaeon]|nr:hypothetical protein [Nitrososphaerota archaeon]
MPDTRYFGYATETVFKTVVAASRYVDQVRDSVVPDLGWIQAETVDKRAPTKRVQGPYIGRGSLETIVEPENVSHFFYYLLGAVSTTGTGPYTHVFKIADDVKSFTGRLGAGLAERILAGCLMDGARFECRSGEGDAGLLRATWDIVNAKGESRGTVGSPSFSALGPFVFHQAAVTLAGADKSSQVTGFTVNYRNNIPVDGLYGFGSRELSSIKVGPANVDCELAVNYEDQAQYDAFLAGTEFAVKVDFVGPSPYRLTFDLPKCVYARDVAPHPERRQTPIRLTAPVHVLHDAAEATPLKITLVNQVSAVS